MIENATILAITGPAVPNGTGGKAFPAATNVSRRCYLGSPRLSSLIAKVNVLADVKAVLIVKIATVTGIVPGGRVRVQLDGGDATNYEVVFREDHVKPGGLSNSELFLKGL